MSQPFSFRRPSDDSIREALDRQRAAPFTYEHVGAIEREHPAGYLRNEVKVRLGTGQAVYESAVAAMRRWQQFDVGWVELCWPSIVPERGAVVGVLARVWGVWALSVTRIVDVIEETSPRRRFAVIYGTLPQHVETGEELFQIEWDPDDDTVWYEVRAFYRPHHPLARWTWPLVSHLPRRFVRQSAGALQRAIQTDGPGKLVNRSADDPARPVAATRKRRTAKDANKGEKGNRQ